VRKKKLIVGLRKDVLIASRITPMDFYLAKYSIKAYQKEINDNLSRLNNLSTEVHDKVIQTLDFMNKYKNSFDMTCLEKESDTICVCGYFINVDGSLPDKLTERLDKVIEVARRAKSAQVLLSGGAVQNQYSEAEAM
jgi:hypothetical protein